MQDQRDEASWERILVAGAIPARFASFKEIQRVYSPRKRRLHRGPSRLGEKERRYGLPGRNRSAEERAGNDATVLASLQIQDPSVCGEAGGEVGERESQRGVACVFDAKNGQSGLGRPRS